MSTLTPFADMAPVPRVLIDVPVSEFPAGSVTVSLRSTCAGRTMAVRGAQRLSATSPIIVVDPEPGFGVPTAYTVVGHDVAGEVVGTWPIGSVTVDFDGVVIQQPLDPRLSVQVVRVSGWAPTLTRRTPGQLVYPEGNSLPGLVGLGPRRGIEGSAIEVLVDSFEAADMLQQTLGTYETRQLPVWLVRTPPGDRMPRIFFCHVPALEEQAVSGSANPGDVLFRATVTEVRPPAVSVSAAVLTYSDVAVFFGTYSALGAAYATYSDIKRDTSLIGAADA